MNTAHTILIIAVSAAVTMALRFTPFIIFGRGQKTPAYITYLGTVLPYSIMGMLVVFCLKNVSVISYPFGIPEAVSCMLVIALHIWKRNTLLSIVGGTICYMVLIQMVF